MAAANADSETLQSNPKFAEYLKILGIKPYKIIMMRFYLNNYIKKEL